MTQPHKAEKLREVDRWWSSAKRWVHWVRDAAARLSELADAHARHIVCLFEIWIMKIHRKYRSPDQRLKTKVSIRDVPLHSAVVAEGFLRYVESVGDGNRRFQFDRP